MSKLSFAALGNKEAACCCSGNLWQEEQITTLRRVLQIRFTAIAIFAFAAMSVPCIAMQVSPPGKPAAQTAATKDFSARLKDYVDLRKSLESQLPTLKSTNDAAKIAAHQSALAAKLVAFRHGARQGDMFTPEIAAQFRIIIRETFNEPGAQIVRNTVKESDIPKPIVVKVNTIYPETSPVVTTPPTLLMRLPPLPMELAYRIIGQSFILLDNKTNLIVDFIPDVVP